MQVTTGLHMELYNVDRELMLQHVSSPLVGEGAASEPAEVAVQR